MLALLRLLPPTLAAAFTTVSAARLATFTFMPRCARAPPSMSFVTRALLLPAFRYIAFGMTHWAPIANVEENYNDDGDDDDDIF